MEVTLIYLNTGEPDSFLSLPLAAAKTQWLPQCGGITALVSTARSFSVFFPGPRQRFLKWV